MILAAFLLLAPGTCQDGAAAGPSVVEESAWELRVSPLADLWFWVRAESHRAPRDGEPAALEAARKAARELESELGGGVYGSLLDGVLADVRSTGELLAAFGLLPEERTLRSGTTIRLREPAVRLVERLQALEPDFRTEVWPDHRATIAAARMQWQEQLASREDACRTLLFGSLGIEPPAQPIPLYLVAVAPAPGGFTVRAREPAAACFVAVEDRSGSLLAEVLLHESVHAAETQSAGTSVMARLRAGLSERGITREQRLWRDLPHTLIFVHSAETVRRVVNPEHRDYGEDAGYYAKVPDAHAALVPAWRSFLDGQATLPETLDRVLAAAVPDAR